MADGDLSVGDDKRAELSAAEVTDFIRRNSADPQLASHRADHAARWLRSDRAERNAFFTPAKLRQAAGGKFRSADYGHHCELGGHPIPRGAAAMLGDELGVGQLLLSDMLGHAGGIWDRTVGWARDHEHGEPVLAQGKEMSARFAAWKSRDPLLAVPPPPALAD